jgi:hypothetical protein
MSNRNIAHTNSSPVVVQGALVNSSDGTNDQAQMTATGFAP